MRGKKNYAPEFKAKVAIEAIKGEKGNAEICSEYKIPGTNLQQWKCKAVESLHQVFIPESEHARKQKLIEDEIEHLHKIIGEITIENNFLKKKLQR
jgi:transposase